MPFTHRLSDVLLKAKSSLGLNLRGLKRVVRAILLDPSSFPELVPADHFDRPLQRQGKGKLHVVFVADDIPNPESDFDAIFVVSDAKDALVAGQFQPSKAVEEAVERRSIASEEIRGSKVTSDGFAELGYSPATILRAYSAALADGSLSSKPDLEAAVEAYTAAMLVDPLFAEVPERVVADLLRRDRLNAAEWQLLDALFLWASGRDPHAGAAQARAPAAGSGPCARAASGKGQTPSAPAVWAALDPLLPLLRLAQVQFDDLVALRQSSLPAERLAAALHASTAPTGPAQVAVGLVAEGSAAAAAAGSVEFLPEDAFQLQLPQPVGKKKAGGAGAEEKGGAAGEQTAAELAQKLIQELTVQRGTRPSKRERAQLLERAQARVEQLKAAAENRAKFAGVYFDRRTRKPVEAKAAAGAGEEAKAAATFAAAAAAAAPTASLSSTSSSSSSSAAAAAAAAAPAKIVVPGSFKLAAEPMPTLASLAAAGFSAADLPRVPRFPRTRLAPVRLTDLGLTTENADGTVSCRPERRRGQPTWAVALESPAHAVLGIRLDRIGYPQALLLGAANVPPAATAAVLKRMNEVGSLLAEAEQDLLCIRVEGPPGNGDAQRSLLSLRFRTDCPKMLRRAVEAAEAVERKAPEPAAAAGAAGAGEEEKKGKSQKKDGKKKSGASSAAAAAAAAVAAAPSGGKQAKEKKKAKAASAVSDSSDSCSDTSDSDDEDVDPALVDPDPEQGGDQVSADGSGEKLVVSGKHAHPLSLTYCPYMSVSGHDGYNCDNCGVSGTGESWHCASCQYDMCPSCAGQFRPEVKAERERSEAVLRDTLTSLAKEVLAAGPHLFCEGMDQPLPVAAQIWLRVDFIRGGVDVATDRAPRWVAAYKQRSAGGDRPVRVTVRAPQAEFTWLAPPADRPAPPAPAAADTAAAAAAAAAAGPSTS